MDYTIKPNDTLSAIAKTYGSDVNAIAKLNNITDPNVIKAGSVLKLPGGNSVVTPNQTTLPTAITSDAIKPDVPIVVPTPPAPVPNTGSDKLTGPASINTASDALIKNTEVADTTTQTKAKTLAQSIADLTGNLGGQTTALVEEQNKAGVPALNQSLTDINNEITAKQAELQQDDTKLIANSRAIENRDTLLPFAQSSQAKLAGDAAILRALKTSEIGVLNARSLALQGNIALAQKTAEQAVEARYAPYKDQIAVYQAQLDALKPILDGDEKDQARKQEIKLNLALKDIDTKTQSAKAVNDIMLEAAKNGANSSVLDAISKATDSAGAIKAAGSALQTGKYVATADGGVLNTLTGVKTFAGGGNPVTLDPSKMVKTVDGKAVTGYTVAPTDTGGLYQIAQNRGIDFQALKDANPNLAANGYVVKPGDVLNVPSPENDFLAGKNQTQIDAYNSLSDIDKSTVKQLINGDALVSDLIKTRGAAGQKQIADLVAKATAIDPNFSINNNKIKYAYQQKWNSPDSPSGKTKVAINTALTHLAETSALSNKLSPDDLQIINKTENWWDTKTGNPDITNLQFALNQLASEIATVYKGGTPSAEEIANEKATLGTEFSRDQFKGVFDTASDFLSGKIASMNYNYKSTIGAYPETPIIDPDVRANLIASGINPDTISPDPTNTVGGVILPTSPSVGSFNGIKLPN